MTTESQIAPESAAGLGGTSSGAFIARPSSLASADRLWVDRFVRALRRPGADPGERCGRRGDLSQGPRRVRGRIFSHNRGRHLRRHSVRSRHAGAKALQPNPADGVGRPGSQRARRLVRGLPDPGVGRVQLGGEPRSVAWRRSFVLGGRRRGASRAPGGVEVRSAERPGKRRAQGRTIVSLSCEENVPPEFTDNLTRHGYHAVAHFHMPDSGPEAEGVIESVISLCRTSDIQEIMLFVDPERLSNVRSVARRLRVLPLPVTLVPFGTLAQLFQRARYDIGDTVAIELQRAALSPREQAIKRGIDIVLSGIGLIILSPILHRRRDCRPAGLARSGAVPADAARLQRAPVPDLQVPHHDRHGKRRRRSSRRRRATSG